jgi:hypothetical protein
MPGWRATQGIVCQLAGARWIEAPDLAVFPRESPPTDYHPSAAHWASHKKVRFAEMRRLARLGQDPTTRTYCNDARSRHPVTALLSEAPLSGILTERTRRTNRESGSIVKTGLLVGKSLVPEARGVKKSRALRPCGKTPGSAGFVSRRDFSRAATAAECMRASAPAACFGVAPLSFRFAWHSLIQILVGGGGEELLKVTGTELAENLSSAAEL